LTLLRRLLRHAPGCSSVGKLAAGGPRRELARGVRERHADCIALTRDLVLQRLRQLDDDARDARLELRDAQPADTTPVDAVPARTTSLGAFEVEDQAAVVHHEVARLHAGIHADDDFRA